MNNRSAPFSFWHILLGALSLVLLVLLTNCMFSRTARLDPRPLDGVYIANDVMLGLVVGFRNAYPAEAAYCLRGELQDTVVDGESQHIAIVTDYFPAVQDSADGEQVYFPRHLPGGCAGGALIGLAHDDAELGPCVHTGADDSALFNNPQAYFSLLFCADGRMQILYRSGHRIMDRWAP